MNTRIFIPLLIAGAVAFAWAPRSHPSTNEALASALPLNASAATEHAARRAHAASDSKKVNAHLSVDAKPHAVRLSLDVANATRNHVELTFPNGKRYDFTVVDSTGHEVWRWSAGRMFTQNVQNRQLPSGDMMQVAELWKNPAPGKYTAIATLNSTNYPVEERQDFVVP